MPGRNSGKPAGSGAKGRGKDRLPIREVAPDLSARGRSSRNKGKVGERELAHLLTAAGFPAIRAQQYKGASDSGDIICPALDALGVHIESKRAEAASFGTWAAQAEADSGGKLPVVCWRRSAKGGEARPPWVAFLRLDDLLTLLRGGGTKADRVAPESIPDES